jgi:hypothetical protein
MSPRTILAFVLAGCGLVALAVWWRVPPRVQPLTSLESGVYYSAGHDWAQFYAEYAPKETGWVHLPKAPEKPDFKSGIDPFPRGFVEAHVCGECHAENYEQFPQTAHFLTSSLATTDTIRGDFSTDKKVLKTGHPDLHFEMESTEDGQFQRVVVKKDGRTYEHRERFDIVTGSGNHGQTYLFWHDDRLCQLPVSYFTELGGWVNSPGSYRDGTADFARGIGGRCLDCHSTFFAPDYSELNRYDRSNFMLGVTCVRCHGPGWAHVQYHRTHLDADEGHYISNPSKLSQARSNEVCAQCHSGVGRQLQPAFSYRPGEPLDEYLQLDMDSENSNHDDPHAANQLLRLMKSRCFVEGEAMTCATCHDPHRVERGNMALFSSRCAKCHEHDACKLHDEHGSKLETRCIQCHMPSKRDAMGGMETTDGILLPLLRDHYIKGWPDATQAVLKEMLESD